MLLDLSAARASVPRSHARGQALALHMVGGEMRRDTCGIQEGVAVDK
jgi:hypothetical protein